MSKHPFHDAECKTVSPRQTVSHSSTKLSCRSSIFFTMPMSLLLIAL